LKCMNEKNIPVEEWMQPGYLSSIEYTQVWFL
jgi:hypothetical protein